LTRLRAITLHQLAVLTGTLDLQLETGDLRSLPVPPTPPAGLPSALLENRPDIRQAEQNLIAENARIGIAKTALYPSITLTGSLGGESLELSDILKAGARIWTFGLGLDLPIFDSGKRKSRVEQATARQKQALAQYQTAIQNAFREVNDALINKRLNAEREQAYMQSEASAKKALTVAENRYKSGYSAYLEVLDAQRVHNDAALNMVQAKQATFLATVELFKVLGGDWKGVAVSAESISTPEPPAN
jgi:outer membrane protein, multidrug efflux system